MFGCNLRLFNWTVWRLNVSCAHDTCAFCCFRCLRRFVQIHSHWRTPASAGSCVLVCTGCPDVLATPSASSDSDLSVGTEVTSILRMIQVRPAAQLDSTSSTRSFQSFSFVVFCVWSILYMINTDHANWHLCSYVAFISAAFIHFISLTTVEGTYRVVFRSCQGALNLHCARCAYTDFCSMQVVVISWQMCHF